MPRWLRIVRGMLGTGLAFAVSGAAIIGLIGLVFAVFGNVSPLSVVFVAARGSVLSFVLGLVFSAAFAVLARHRDVSRWSLGKFTALGGGVGLTAFVAMGLNGAFNAWSVPTALVNLGLLTAVGAGSAAATLLLARRGSAALPSSNESQAIHEGSAFGSAAGTESRSRYSARVVR